MLAKRIWLEDAARLSRAVELVEEIAPPRPIRVDPDHIVFVDEHAVAEQHLRHLHEQVVETVEPGLALYRVRDVLVAPNGAMVTQAGHLLNDSLGPYRWDGDIATEFAPMLRLSPSGGFNIAHRDFDVCQQVHFSLRDHGEAGYFHFTNVVLPAATLRQNGYPHIPAYYDRTTRFQTDFLRLAGVGEGNLATTGRPVLFRELLLLSSSVRPDGNTGGFFERAGYSVNALRHLVRGFRPGSVDRVYISRRDSSVRRNPSEDLIEQIVTGHFGFTAVVLSGMSVNEQIELFKGARSVLGLHGAGLSNMIFMRRDSRVLEIFPPERIWPTFRALAHRCQHQYAAMVLGQRVPDPAKLRRFLEMLLGSEI